MQVIILLLLLLLLLSILSKITLLQRHCDIWYVAP